MGWEVKQHKVSNFKNLPASLLLKGTAITLMTPEPSGGAYKEDGVESFIREYGYPDQSGRDDRINFGGKYIVGKPYHLNNVRMEMIGFTASNRTFDPEGSLQLFRGNEKRAAAEWKFSDLLKHWTRKHSKAVYVPSLSKDAPIKSYQYAEYVRLGEGTEFIRFLKGLQDGLVYYDPGIKLENASSRPTTKRRSQFRILSGDIPVLYEKMTTVNCVTERD